MKTYNSLNESRNNNNYYARLTTLKGEVIELDVDKNGELKIREQWVQCRLETNAKHITCIDTNIISIDAPYAESIFCTNCYLSTLDAPIAKDVRCVYNNLTKLNVPNALIVDCENNKLTSLTLPNAVKVHCGNNKILTSLEAPNANEVRCKGTPKLKDENINVPEDCEIYR